MKKRMAKAVLISGLLLNCILFPCRKGYASGYKDNFIVGQEEQKSVDELKKSMSEYGTFIGGGGMPFSEFEEAMENRWIEIKDNGRYRVNKIDLTKKYDYDTNIRQYLTNLQRLDGVRMFSIGKSSKGRPIYMLEIDRTTVENPKIIVLTGNVHARETAGSMFIVKQLNDLLNDKNNEEYLSKVKIVTVPCVNPDGREGVSYNTKKYTYSDGQLWKANLNGVDIGRNFPGLSWGQIRKGNQRVSFYSDNPETMYYPGPYAGSESETKALMKFLYHYVVEEKADMLIDYHQQGRIVYAGKPWQTQQQQDRCEELGKYISKILANGKTYKFTREVSTYGLRGEGSTLSDYACGLAMGACFSRDYGFFVFSDGVEEYPLIAGKIAGEEANSKFCTATVEIGSGVSFLGYSDSARQKIAAEYKNYHFDTMLYKLCDFLFEKDKVVVKLDDFKVLKQGEYKTGCESVATVSVLNYLGYDITKKTFIEKYLPRIDTTEEFYQDEENQGKLVYDYYFVGNPKSSAGKACNSRVIVEAVEKYFTSINEADVKPVNLTDRDFSVLVKKLQEGKPVIIWLSINLTGSGKLRELGGVSYYTMRHTGVLTGVDEKKSIVYFADSISGKLYQWPIAKVKEIFVKYGKQAVVIE